MKVDITFREKCLTIGVMTAVALSLSIFIGNIIIIQGIVFALYSYLLLNDRPTLVYAICAKLPRDIVAAYGFLRADRTIKSYEKHSMTVAKAFEKNAKKHPKKIAFMMNDIRLKFEDVEDFTNKIASYFKLRNYTKGDTVALLMEANPYYSCIWLGLSKIGIITALINTNLKKESLAYCIKIANSKAIIVGSEMVKVLEEIRHESGVRELPLYQLDHTESNSLLMPEAIDMTAELKKCHSVSIKEEIRSCKPRDKLLYIYTSGTTGLPKAAVITNLRYITYTTGCNIMIRMNSNEIIYTALPLYHTAGGIVGSGQVFINGLTQAIRPKFSASNFWTDCIKYNCTMAQYIGEICRYVLSVPAKPEDRSHSVRLMYGNGLRPQIWSQFKDRFGIEKFVEIYGSTEGISNTINIDNQMGAVGFMPRFPQNVYPNSLVRCNELTGEVIRNKSGRCIKCKPGEPGVFIGKIDPKSPILSYSGYVDEKASKKKVLTNVFHDGDNYFDSGDILVMDVYGYFYFKDRLGDTFRWRGENVSTTEVEAVISNIVQLQDCIAYGVEVPNAEGRAGMAAIVDVNHKIDFIKFAQGIKDNLAPYARPVFLRILENVHMTGTFKLVKKDLQSEGFNIKCVKDPVYLLQNDGTYKRLTDKDYDDIINGRTRL